MTTGRCVWRGKAPVYRIIHTPFASLIPLCTLLKPWLALLRPPAVVSSAPYGFADAVAGQKSTKSAALEEHLATTERTLEPLLLQVRATIARARGSSGDAPFSRRRGAYKKNQGVRPARSRNGAR